MANIEKIIAQFENFKQANMGNLEDAKEAFFHKNWKEFCQTMKPILQNAEDLNIIVKGTANKVYSGAVKGGNEVYVKASHLAANAMKSFVKNAQKMNKHGSDNIKAFLDDLNKLSVSVFKVTKEMIHQAAHNAHMHKKST